jgi:hypothetical protein
MANRRKFLAGLGALASGSAAAVGTGAFTSVSANRDLSVAVADDADALLSIDDIDGSPNSAYVDTSGDGVSISITTDIDNDGTDEGTGLNNNALTKIQDLLRIENQGTQDVYVYADGMPTNPRVALGTQASSQIKNAGTGPGNNQADVNPSGSGGAFSLNSSIDPEDIDDDEGTGEGEAAPLLAPGDYVNVEMFAYGDLTGLDFDGTVQIKAEAVDQVD